MIGSVSNYTSYIGSTSTTTSNARSQQFQKDLLSKLDANSDGAVDQDELNSALSQKTDDGLLVSLSENFADLDSDASGSLSSEEMAAMAPPPPPPRDPAADSELADTLIKALDSDGDGTLSSDELDSGLSSIGSTADSTAIFSALDKNQDGTVSKDELAASFAPPPPPQQSGEAVSSSSGTDSVGNAGTTTQSTTREALEKMIANLSKQYSLDKAASVGKYLNVAT
ncbi:histidine kinase|uniref:EF-hand domain-containing protein n=1 Tax=Pseudomonas sp. SbOxS1 TaxID=2723884 RepID=UPI0015D12556|nr:EF-hand domain-containing protein [Pseudomonas sp. SbOxS1]NYU02226.1 histidine kinase [Pseudomonas sp. SbOxS1]